MAGATRTRYQKAAVRSVPPSSQVEHPTSSESTIVYDDMNVVPGVSKVHSGGGYVTQKTECSYDRTDSRLSQDFDPLSINSGNGDRSDSAATATGEVEPLGEHVKEAITVISRLEGLGLQRLQIPLPKCVVLGEQSTGKSSVIEAISGIKTPRSTDTCTRCPLFIKMEASDDPQAPWEARIILRLNYSWDGKPRSKFPGWVANASPKEVPFASVSSPHALEELIARAQKAILAPLNDPEEFLQPAALSRAPNTYHQAQFSPNVVCIYVSQPDLPSLSFYDLPGIIGQSESTAQHFLVKFVRDLVSDFVRDRDSLILVTCSLENDIANSTAGGIARDLKATDRCIGVLTKPDRLPPGSREDRLRDVLDGRRFSLGHGYFVVKNLGQDAIDQGLTHRDARHQERQFFHNASPWSTAFGDYQDRFGTMNLQTYLSKRLAAQVLKMLPTIRAQVHERLQKVEADLKQLPEPPTHNATRIISDILLDFSEYIRKEMEAEYPCRAWRNTWESLHKSFLKGLVSMKPTMLTSGKLDECLRLFDSGFSGKSADEALVIDSDDENDEDTEMANSDASPPKKRKVGHNTPTPAATNALGRHAQTPGTPSSSRVVDVKPVIPDSDYASLRKVFKLDDVARHLKETCKSRIPDQLEPKVMDDLILATIQEWHRPLERFFNGLEKELKTMIQSVFHQKFGQWQGSALYRDAWAIIEDLLNTNFMEQRTTMAMESLNDERDGPHIFNEDTFNREKAHTLEQYRQARYRARLKKFANEMQAQTGRPFTPADQEKLRKDDKRHALLMEEPYRKEIDVIAQVASYYMTAARRFYESVCIRVESKFFKRLRTTLRDDLDTGLGIHDDKDGSQNAMQLLAEPTHRLEQRRELQAMKNALLQGLQCLKELQDKYEDGPPSSSQADVSYGMNGFGSFGPTSTPLTEDMVDITRAGQTHR